MASLNLLRTSSCWLLVAGFLAGCAQMPGSGPDSEAIGTSTNTGPVQLVDVDDRVARVLAANRKSERFSDTLAQPAGPDAAGAVARQIIGPGDTLEVSIWEAPPAALFGSGLAEMRAGASAARPAVLPEQVVDEHGQIVVPFAGSIQAAGRTVQEIAAEVVARLRGKANQPEVLVRRSKNTSAMVTLVGEFSSNLRIPLTPGGERVLDALAAAGGVRQPINKVTLRLTRGARSVAMPLDTLIQDPLQNVPLKAGDVLTAQFQPLSFTALGATGRNEEIAFEAKGISLAQALARVGGLQDGRSDAQGVFLFRFERPDALPSWPRQPVATTVDGQVPVVYRLDLRNPASFFAIQGFEMRDKDVLFVSNAPAAELQKFLTLVFSVVYPVISTVQLVAP